MRRLGTLLATALLLLACTSEDETPSASPTSTTATETPVVVEASPTETATPTPTVEVMRWPEPPSGLPVVELEARTDAPPDADRVLTLGEPESPFPDVVQPIEDVRLYDFETGEVEVLGPSFYGGGQFSPDGRYLAWAEPKSEDRIEVLLRVRDMESGNEQEFDVHRPMFQFIGEHLILSADQLIDLDVGEMRVIEPLPDGSNVELDDGLLLQSYRLDIPGDDYTRHWTVWSGFKDEALFEVIGWHVDVLDEETVAVMTEPVDRLATIYLVDVPTLTTQLVATTRQPFPGDLEGEGRHLAWTENSCQINEEQTDYVDRLRIWDRETGMLTVLDDRSFVAAVEDGRLAPGGFGPYGWFEIETGEWLAALPTPGERAGWSPDLRYASVGMVLGHGGRCP
ncbi:MAG: hypothetical protein M0R75_10110 [Dehalococcoidia bacterium]|nr:hypothetical protein [Dehalococcoidia bacterium]